MTEDVTISQARNGDASTVTVSGEIDVASAPALRSTLNAICEEGVASITVDLRGVTFLDSSALGVLVGALRRCREHDSRFQLVVDSHRLLKIFEITGLNSVFDIVETAP